MLGVQALDHRGNLLAAQWPFPECASGGDDSTSLSSCEEYVEEGLTVLPGIQRTFSQGELCAMKL